MVEDKMPRPEVSYRTPEHSAQPERESAAPINFRSRRGEVTAITVGGVVQTEPAAILEAANRFIHETVGTETKKADLSTEASIRSEYRTAREVSDFLPALLAYLQKESFRFKADDLNKLTLVEAKLQYLSERLTNILVHLDEVLWKKRNEARATQALRRDRLSTTTLRAMGRAAKASPYIAAALSYVLAPVAAASNAGAQDNRPPVVESDYRDAAAHEREESETEQIKLFTNIRNIEVYVDALEMAVKEVLGDSFEAVLDGSDPDLDIETDVELSKLEQEVPQNSFDIPVFTLDTETSANVLSALDGLPDTGTSAPLPEDFVSNPEVVNGYFGNSPELARQINAQYEALTQFRSLNGNGEILLIVRPAQGEQIMVSTVIKITQEFTDPATGITYTPDSLYGNAQNFMIDVNRKEVFGLESTPMAVIVTEEMAQTMPNPVGTLALLERSDEGKIIAIQTEAGKRVFLDFTANSENPVNLRQDTSTSGTPLATVNSYTLVRGKAPEGAYNGPDDIIFKDGSDMVWVRASALNENGQLVEGWVSTTVVELKATPIPEAAATPDISSETGEDVDLTSTEDPNDDTGEDGNDDGGEDGNDDGGEDGGGEEVSAGQGVPENAFYPHLYGNLYFETEVQPPKLPGEKVKISLWMNPEIDTSYHLFIPGEDARGVFNNYLTRYLEDLTSTELYVLSTDSSAFPNVPGQYTDIPQQVELNKINLADLNVVLVSDIKEMWKKVKSGMTVYNGPATAFFFDSANTLYLYAGDAFNQRLNNYHEFSVGTYNSLGLVLAQAIEHNKAINPNMSEEQIRAELFRQLEADTNVRGSQFAAIEPRFADLFTYGAPLPTELAATLQPIDDTEPLLDLTPAASN